MFKDRTVFSIAHRIKSISDSDKILMVADGRAQQKKVYNSYRELVAANYGASE
jgi:ABC-type multidrug transport system fused ATPase/permease subunit